MFTFGFVLVVMAAAFAAIVQFFVPTIAYMKKYVAAVAVVGLIFCVSAGWYVVRPGFAGVQVFFGHVYQTPLYSGPHIINPLSTVDEMPVRTVTYRMSQNETEGEKLGNDAVVALSSNGMQMHLEINIPYRLYEAAAPWVYENFGDDYVDKLVRPAARSAVTKAVAQYTDHECYSSDAGTGGKRSQLAETIKTNIDAEIMTLVAQYKDAPSQVISVPEVQIGKVDIPDSVKASIEKKVAADQEAQAMEFRLKKESLEAKRKEIEAKGIQTFQKIVAEGISPELLEWKGIEATTYLAESPNTKVIVIGGGKNGLPLIFNDTSMGATNPSAKHLKAEHHNHSTFEKTEK